MSVHALKHLVAQVCLYGPLWTTSAAVFENFFHSLVHRLHGTRDEARLLVRNFLRYTLGSISLKVTSILPLRLLSTITINGRKFVVSSKS